MLNAKSFRNIMQIAVISLALSCWAMAKDPGDPIKAKEITVEKLNMGQSIDITPADYWRSNILIENNDISGQRNAYASHVPGLLEYKINLAVGGEYELQGKYKTDKPAMTYLSKGGKQLAVVFEKAGDFNNDWVSLAKFTAREGASKIRFTSQYVETPFPVISGLRLVYLGGQPPAAEPQPPLIGYRKELPKDWYKTVSRKIHCDFHTGGFVKGVGKYFDGNEFGETLAKNKINSIAIFAKCHHGYAYYNTKFGTRHPGLDFDLMKAQIDACHKRNIAVWVYVSIGMDELYVSTCEHDKIDSDPQGAHFLPIKVDVNTPYITEYTWPMIEECVRQYDIDGFFFDFPGDERFVQETIKMIKAIKPGVAVVNNHQWNKTREGLSKIDILEIESWKHDLTLYSTPYIARYARGAVPMTSMLIRFWQSWGDFGGIADEPLLQYQAASGLANGCCITVGDQLHPYGRLDPAVYQRIGKVMERVEKIEPYVFDSTSVPYVALLRQKMEYSQALLDAGIHFDVVDETMSLTPYKALVIADAGTVKDKYVDVLEQYVKAGGNLLVCGKISDRMAQLLCVQPVKVERPDAGYIRVDNRKLPSPPAMDIYSYEKVETVRAAKGTTVLADLVWPITHNTPHHVSHLYGPASDTVSGLAAVTYCDFGNGKVSYSAVPLFEVYASKGYTAMRQVMVDMLYNMVKPKDRLAEVVSETPLEVSINAQGEKIIVHLVAYPQSRRASEHDNPISDGLPTISNVILKMPKSLVGDRWARQLEPAAKLKQNTKDGVVSMRLADFKVNAVVVLEKSKGSFLGAGLNSGPRESWGRFLRQQGRH